MAKRGRPQKKAKITKIHPDIELDSDEGKDLAWYRDRLNSVQGHVWDKCMEGLDNTKAMGKWPELMKIIQDLAALVDIADNDTELILDFDVVATREVATA